MKKLRGKSKSGFTLLEVLLATVILVIASTMIMQGFIAVMVLGANNRSFAKSGDYNYRLAINQALVGHATASNQIADITSMTDNTYGILTPKVESGSPVTFDAKRDLGLIVDINAYTNSDAGMTYNVGGDDIDNGSVANNRYAFFYDFGDYIHCSDDHIIRWGFTLDPAKPSESHGNYTEPVYDNRGRVVAYGRYGWYCFNALHTGENACAYRTSPYTGFIAVT
ncbi:MAG: type II secretion system protein [Clostridiales bacterium]|nr:type II secretion system protein [Clostridiales bacterium]